jgi:hypothetical protein
MAIKSSGALSFATDIVGEFADSAPHSMSEFYGGGDKVPAGANPGVATSGTINFNSFYDCVAATVLTISSNTNDYNIGAACIAAGGDKATPVILTINAGVTVGSTASTIPAMKTDTGWSSGVSITITNNGSIVGSTGVSDSTTSSQTGTGGNGGTCSGLDPQAAGSGTAGSASSESVNNGGSAFEHSQTADNALSVIFDTAGTRTAGAGGVRTALGGGGGGGHGGNAYVGYVQVRGGGGGGAGTPGGSGGGTCGHTTDGSAGSATSGGAGGPSAGAGGNLGQAGGAGGSNFSGSTAAGSAGSSSTSNGSSGSVLSGNTGQIS